MNWEKRVMRIQLQLLAALRIANDHLEGRSNIRSPGSVEADWAAVAELLAGSLKRLGIVRDMGCHSDGED